MPSLSRIFLIAVFALAARAAGARTALEFFVDLPVERFNMLSRTTRLDMIDYFNAGLTTPSENVFGGKSRILAASDLSADILVSKNSVATLAVIPNDGDTVVALIETVKTPTPDSSAGFVRASDWSALDVELPALADFMTPEARKAGLTAADFPEMTFTTIEFDPTDGVFTFRDRTAQHYRLPEGSRTVFKALDYIRDSIRRQFRKGRLTKPSEK